MRTRNSKPASPPSAATTTSGAGNVSAVAGMSVTSVRRAMDGVRGNWKAFQEDGGGGAQHQLMLSKPLCECGGAELSMQGFCMRFVLGQHAKRRVRASKT